MGCTGRGAPTGGNQLARQQGRPRPVITCYLRDGERDSVRWCLPGVCREGEGEEGEGEGSTYLPTSTHDETSS